MNTEQIKAKYFNRIKDILNTPASQIVTSFEQNAGEERYYLIKSEMDAAEAELQNLKAKKLKRQKPSNIK